MYLTELGERKLFTPGPLGISKTTKEAMVKDVGSRETEFVALVKSLRERLVKMAGIYTFFVCFTILSPANEVWSKVMFLHLSIILSGRCAY